MVCCLRNALHGALVGIGLCVTTWMGCSTAGGEFLSEVGVRESVNVGMISFFCSIDGL